MAFATQITIASGRTVYEGDPENDNGITSRQVQVQVTYSLERGDADLLEVTERKAREVEAAQEAVWRRVRKDQPELAMEGAAPGVEFARDEDPGDTDDPGPPSVGLGGDDGGAEDGDDFDEAEDDAEAVTDDHPASPNGQAPACTEACVNGPQARPVTKPQKLAIGAQARRLGLSDVALAELIRERFGKSSFTPRYAVERLTKAEADALLRELAGREWEAVRTGERARPAPA